ncbi:hypothetical protein JHK87_055514 [Glycine soja]|nr:hypothetical protein JHK87_055514 [Glycine soja]
MPKKKEFPKGEFSGFRCVLECFETKYFIIMHNLQELAHNRPIISMEHFLEQVAWPEAQLPLVRPNEAAPPEPTPMQVNSEPTDPQSPVRAFIKHDIQWLSARKNPEEDELSSLLSAPLQVIKHTASAHLLSERSALSQKSLTCAKQSIRA